MKSDVIIDNFTTVMKVNIVIASFWHFFEDVSE
jgi:hypothetical protein